MISKYIKMVNLSQLFFKHNENSILAFIFDFCFFRNNVYKGRPKHRPRKNHLDMMFEHFMHKTGHDHMK